MIKRYILHFEFHWRYWPRISIKRVPRPGDRVFDGGEWGTLIACPECSGDGLLHLVESEDDSSTLPEELAAADPNLLRMLEALHEYRATMTEDEHGLRVELQRQSQKTCKCKNLADDSMPPDERIGDEEAKRRGLWLTTECPIHREI